MPVTYIDYCFVLVTAALKHNLLMFVIRIVYQVNACEILTSSFVQETERMRRNVDGGPPTECPQERRNHSCVTATP